MKKSFVAIFFLIPCLACAQDADLWPVAEMWHSYEDSSVRETFENYNSGNVFARGPLTKSGEEEVIVSAKNMRKEKHTVYARTGVWTVYYDSSVSVILSQGTFVDGEKDGLWKVFDRQGNVIKEYVFDHDLVRQQTDIDATGNRKVVVERSDRALLFLRYELLFFFLGLGPIVGIRIIWNILTWNKIYGTNYIPGFQKFQKGGTSVNLFVTLIFWWIHKSEDTSEVTRYKTIGNWISVLSIIVFALFIWFIPR